MKLSAKSIKKSLINNIKILSEINPNEFLDNRIKRYSKLGYYTEHKWLNINIISPDINLCNSDFYSDTKNFYYALGALKNVGYEAISNIVKEREKNGKFKSLNDFIHRVDTKDVNKLQLEGLVKAGAFDNLNINRQSLLESIPNIIIKNTFVSIGVLAIFWPQWKNTKIVK